MTPPKLQKPIGKEERRFTPRSVVSARTTRSRTPRKARVTPDYYPSYAYSFSSRDRLINGLHCLQARLGKRRFSTAMEELKQKYPDFDILINKSPRTVKEYCRRQALYEDLLSHVDGYKVSLKMDTLRAKHAIQQVSQAIAKYAAVIDQTVKEVWDTIIFLMGDDSKGFNPHNALFDIITMFNIQVKQIDLSAKLSSPELTEKQKEIALELYNTAMLKKRAEQFIRTARSLRII